MRILFSWIGDTDLASVLSLTEKCRKPILEYFHNKGQYDREHSSASLGPIRTLLNAQSFDRIYLFSNYSREITEAFGESVKEYNVAFRRTELSTPTNYDAIFTFVDQELSDILTPLKGTGYQSSILLSPGTPAMAAVWVLLGKSRYPSLFYEAYKGKVSETEIPFDLSVDFLPELMRNSDTLLQRLMVSNPQEIAGFENVLGKSQQIRMAVGIANKASLRDVPVLLTGESGTGKEVFAHAIHLASSRRKATFIPLNCAALPRGLLESELFGYEKGSHNMAREVYRGAFEQADKGTLFLDEIGECPLDIQAKLLRVLQPPVTGPLCTREIRRLGAKQIIHVDVRILAATNRNLLEMVKAGAFREDLYYRIAVIAIKLPPLRQRKGDLKELAIMLLSTINEEFRKDDPEYRDRHLSASALNFIARYDWPGNVRQLKSVLLQSSVLSDSEELNAKDLEAAVIDRDTRITTDTAPSFWIEDGFDLDQHIREIKGQYLEAALSQSGGIKAKAARLLGLRSYQRLDAMQKQLKPT